MLFRSPSTFADRQDIDRVPGDEAGWLAFGEFLAAAERTVLGRHQRIETLGREIDALAEALYRAKPGARPAPRPSPGVREPAGPLL